MMFQVLHLGTLRAMFTISGYNTPGGLSGANGWVGGAVTIYEWLIHSWVCGLYRENFLLPTSGPSQNRCLSSIPR